MAQKVTIETAYNVELDFYLADAMDRVWSHLIDMIIKIGYLILIFAIFDIFNNFHLVHLLLIMPYLLYSLLFELLNNGQTPGKKALEIQVVSLDGKNLRTGQLMTRWFLRLIDFMFFSAGVALLSVMSTRKAQRVGDVVANTGVISLKKNTNISKSSRVKLPKGFVGTNRDVMRLEEEEIELLKEVIRSRESSAFITQKAAAEKISEFLDIAKEDSSKDFLKNIVYQYNYFHMVDDGLIEIKDSQEASSTSEEIGLTSALPDLSSKILDSIDKFDITSSAKTNASEEE